MLQKIKILAKKEINQLLINYKLKYQESSEIERIQGAIQLIKSCPKNSIKYLPSVPNRSDYWYLIQLLSKEKHILKNKTPYFFTLNNSPTIYLEKNNEIQQLLIKKEKNKQIINNCSRAILDKLIEKNQYKTLLELDIDPQKWRIAPIPYDIFIRLEKHQIEIGNFNYHLDGYRLRTDENLTNLIGGHKQFGGQQFVDSIWTSTISSNIKTKLAIIPIKYGQ